MEWVCAHVPSRVQESGVGSASARHAYVSTRPCLWARGRRVAQAQQRPRHRDGVVVLSKLEAEVHVCWTCLAGVSIPGGREPRRAPRLKFDGHRRNPVPSRMWQGRAHCQCRCGSGASPFLPQSAGAVLTAGLDELRRRPTPACLRSRACRAWYARLRSTARRRCSSGGHPPSSKHQEGAFGQAQR